MTRDMVGGALAVLDDPDFCDEGEGVRLDAPLFVIISLIFFGLGVSATGAISAFRFSPTFSAASSVLAELSSASLSSVSDCESTTIVLLSGFFGVFLFEDVEPLPVRPFLFFLAASSSSLRADNSLYLV